MTVFTWPAGSSALGTIASIVLAFLASSIDDYALLACLYASPRASVREITAAKMICAALALCMAVALATACLALPLPLSRFMGLVPLALGASRLIGNGNSRSAADEKTAEVSLRIRTGSAMRRVSYLVTVLFAASFDNIALYLPLFMRGGWSTVAIATGLVLALTVPLCGLALVSSSIQFRFRGAQLRLGPAVPYLMMFIGVKALAS
jgi:cadmium resistance protein CadD (predicted permease)